MRDVVSICHLTCCSPEAQCIDAILFAAIDLFTSCVRRDISYDRIALWFKRHAERWLVLVTIRLGKLGISIFDKLWVLALSCRPYSLTCLAGLPVAVGP